MKALILALALAALAPLGGSTKANAPKPETTSLTAAKGEYVAAYRPYRYRYYRYRYHYRYRYQYRYRYWSDARPVTPVVELATVTV